MEPWERVIAMVTVIAFFLQIRPMDSFLTAFLTGPGVGVTLDEVSNDLTPVCIYMSVIGVLLVSVISDYVRYKPVMIFCTLMGVLSYVCLIDSSTLFILKVYQICYAFLMCADPIYFSYLFAIISDKDQYQKATGYATAGMMSGKLISGVLSQLIIFLNNGNYYVLVFYSLASMTFACVWIFFLPSVKRGKNFHVVDGVAVKSEIFSKEVIRDPNILKYSAENGDHKKFESELVVKNSLKRILEDIKLAYTDLQILRWTFWQAISMTGYVQVILYINILYSYIEDVSEDKYVLLNGLANFLATLSAAICTYKIGKIHVDWSSYGDTFLAISSLVIAITMFLCFWSTNEIVVYVMYICYYALIQSVFVISISQIGKLTKNNRYGLILGISMFIGMVLSMFIESIMTHLKISVPGHFLVYSSMFTVVGIVYGYIACYTNCTSPIMD